MTIPYLLFNLTFSVLSVIHTYSALQKYSPPPYPPWIISYLFNLEIIKDYQKNINFWFCFPSPVNVSETNQVLQVVYA